MERVQGQEQREQGRELERGQEQGLERGQESRSEGEAPVREQGQGQVREQELKREQGRELERGREQEQAQLENLQLMEAIEHSVQVEQLMQTTPARIGVKRAGTRPLTSTMLTLRLDHAAAVDSVYGEVSESLLEEMGFFTVRTTCADKEDYLRRPDKGRLFDTESEAAIAANCTARPQVQIVVSDGLSAEAVEANIREAYPALLNSLQAQGLSWGTTFFVKNGRVACLNAIGRLLEPEVAVILIGERPGLVSASSMSAYMGYRPRMGMLESDRNVISNIHRGGTPPAEAGALIAARLKAMLDQRVSGVGLVTTEGTKSLHMVDANGKLFLKVD